MIPPGWNVTEPISLAAGLLRVIDSLKAAPDDAKAFTAKIERFRRALTELQRVLEKSRERDPNVDHADLRDTLADCQVCVQRCQRFQESFQKLTSDGTATMANAGQVALWVWKDKQITRLRHEIDNQINSVGLTLLIKSFADEQERRNPTTSSTSAQRNSVPLSGRADGNPVHSYTPADLLGLSRYTELPYVTAEPVQMPIQRNELASTCGSSELPMKSSTQPVTMPTIRPSPVTPPQLSSSPQELPFPPSQISPTARGTTVTPSSRDSVSTWNSPSIFSSTVSEGTSVTDTTIDRRSSLGSLASLNPPCADMIMENLKVVKMSYEKGGQRFTYPVKRIEIRRDSLSKVRCIVVTPRGGSGLKFYQIVPRSERLLPHSEHFSAYGDIERRRIKFLQPHRLDAQHIDACTSGSSACSVASMSPPKSVRSSIGSLSSIKLKTLSENVEYEFEEEFGERSQEAASVSWAMSSDYRRFQELIMGQGVQMPFHGPVHRITAKRSGALKCTTICERQNIRLWEYPSRQTLMFYANMSGTTKEYDLQCLRPVETKSKTELRLDVTLPKKSRRSSSSASSASSNTILVGDEAASIHDRGKDDLESLSYITIIFSYAEDKTSFLQAARLGS